MKNRSRTLLSFAAILIFACSFPLFNGTGANPPGTASSGVPSAAESPTVTVSTSGAPLASPNGQAVNCRSGPGTGWPVVVLLNPGQTAEIVGHNAEGTWWYVKNPAAPGTFCWMSAAFTATSGDLSGVPVVAAPPTSPAPPTSAAVVVTDVSVSIDPEDIQVGGCVGPIQPSTITAVIEVNGPIKIQYHFETEQNGAFPIHSLNFNKAGQKDVTQDFTPPVIEGEYWVRLMIDDMNLSGMDTEATYEIGC